MSDSTLSFVNSSSFRNALLNRNLPSYQISGIYSSNDSGVNSEIAFSNSNVVDSPNQLIYNDPFANTLYPLNEYGPEGGYNLQISYNNLVTTSTPNKGEYDITDTQLDLINEKEIDNSYRQNKFGPNGGYEDMVYVSDVQITGKIFQPYWDPPSYLPSSYSPYSILFSNNPNGDNGLLSQDSYLAKIGAKQLNWLFQERIAAEVFQNTLGRVNLESLQDPFEASLIVTGKEPLIYKNWRITVPENPIVAAVDFGARLSGSYWPVSLIPGDYFNENITNTQSTQTSNALNVVNQLTGGFLGPILNLTRTPSQIFLANTGNGQRSVLFANIDYNRYQPSYDKNYGGLYGVIQGLVNLFVDIIDPNNGTLIGGYYVGSRTSDPSFLTSPPNEIPVNAFGQQVPSPVYGPDVMAKQYEGNEEGIKFGLAGKSLADGGGIDGQFVWTSDKTTPNSGFKATPGGGIGSVDTEFNSIRSQYQSNESINLDFKKTSILDQTQRLIDSADGISGIKKLRHVGNAINQISKVFNDGYKEMTKGSRVISYSDLKTQKGIEYCRVFTKDTPYFTYNDLQKTDGITTYGRQVPNSVLDNTYNLNIAPLKNPGSTNIKTDSTGRLVAKKYMFSIENLAWRTSRRPGFTYDDLPVCEKGPNGGRVMWFPPYDLQFNDTSTASWGDSQFLGRPEPIYTYKNTSRSGSLSWKIIVDHPSVMNVIVDKYLKNIGEVKANSIIDSFFAGCLKYDLYTIASQFSTIPLDRLYTYQELLNNPNITDEEASELINREVKINNDITTNNIETIASDFENQFNDLAFYFDNDYPDPNTRLVISTGPFNYWFDGYEQSFNKDYVSKANSEFNDWNANVKNFFDNVVVPNYNTIRTEFFSKCIEIVEAKGVINIKLIGSASSPAKKDYNVNLSKRRIDSVKQFFIEYGKTIDKDISQYIDNGNIIINDMAFGEELELEVTPKMLGDISMDVINCTEDIKNKNGKVTHESQIYAVSAMACRRVKLRVEVAYDKEANIPPENPQVVEAPQPIKPLPTITVEKKEIKGLRKKVLRDLLSECDYFEVIKQEVPMLYSSIIEKIKYFNPAFHSMTPEGLNARLTFLNQCVRPGETIPVIGVDGKPKYDNSVNTSFGSAPVLVLRIGDFFNTKIIPENLSFSYDPLVLDINPEGIGIQPMIAKVTLTFKIIGGMGLEKPINELQNALSFNYYANTEVYDERSVTNEDVTELDKKVLRDIEKNDRSLASTGNVVNLQENNFGNTIGTIVTLTNPLLQVNGVINYKSIMDNIFDETKNYFNNIGNQLENAVLMFNYEVLSIVNDKRNYTDGTINGTDTFIYGKPSSWQDGIKDKFDEVINEIDDNSNFIIKTLIDNYNYSGSTSEIRVLKSNLQKYVSGLTGTFNENLSNIVSNISDQQQNYVQLLRKISVVSQKIDGLKGNDGIPVVYDISGVTKPPYIDTYQILTDDLETLCNSLNSYLILIDTLVFNTVTINVPDVPFYTIIANVFSDKNKINQFKEACLVTIKDKTFIYRFNKIVNELSDSYNTQLKREKKIFVDLKKNDEYNKYINGTDEVLYQKGTEREFNYSVASSTTGKIEVLSGLFSSVNNDTDTITFDGKIKFN